MKKIIYIFLSLLLFAGCNETVSDAKQETVLPQIYPDYIGVTIPVNIAPLNFCMADETAERIDAVVTDSHGHRLHSQSNCQAGKRDLLLFWGEGGGAVDFDLDDWHTLLAQNPGDSLIVTVSAKYADGWHTYQPFSLYVSPDSIDYGLCYRLIAPGYEVWSKMGIYERDLSTFDERPLIENTQFEGCVNCHSFNRGNPADMSLHIRGPHSATLLRHSLSFMDGTGDGGQHSPLLRGGDGGGVTAYNTKTDQTLGFCVYPYWHPSGRYIAYSNNTTRQLFHSANPNRIEVFDEASDIQVYDVEKNELIPLPVVGEASKLCSVVGEASKLCRDTLFHRNPAEQDIIYETFPVFSADGRSLYFCAAKNSVECRDESLEFATAIPIPDVSSPTRSLSADGKAVANSTLYTLHSTPETAVANSTLYTLNSKLNEIHYNLYRIDFDPATGTFGNRIDTIIDAAHGSPLSFGEGSGVGFSVSFPRPSYDGRFLCYTLSDYGQFSIWHHEADLWLLDLRTGVSRPMTEANSDDTESFHNWSANSRWLVFSSRRDDGLFTRAYFCHVDTNGVVTKAFMLPQRNPRRFYRDRFLSFNVPEFIIGPTRFDTQQAIRLINDESRKNFGVRKPNGH